MGLSMSKGHTDEERDSTRLIEYFSDDVVGPFHDLPPLDLRRHNNRLAVLFGEVCSPKKFYLKLRVEGEQLNVLQRKLAKFYRNYSDLEELLFPSSAVLPGVVCASYSEEYGWQRTRIFRPLNNERLIRIYRVDHGTISNARISSLRKLHKKFAFLEQQSFHARLANVEPIRKLWSKEAKTFFCELTKNCDVWASILHIDEKAHVVSVNMTFRKDNEEIDMAMALVAEGYARVVGDTTKKTVVATESIVHIRPETTEDCPHSYDDRLIKHNNEPKENEVNEKWDEAGAARGLNMTLATAKVELSPNSSTSTAVSPLSPTTHGVSSPPETMQMLTANQGSLLVEQSNNSAYLMRPHEPIRPQLLHPLYNYSQLPFPQSTYPQQSHQPSNFHQQPYPPLRLPHNNPNNMNTCYSYNPGPSLPPPANYTGAPAWNAPTAPHTQHGYKLIFINAPETIQRTTEFPDIPNTLPPTLTMTHGFRQPPVTGQIFNASHGSLLVEQSKNSTYFMRHQEPIRPQPLHPLYYSSQFPFPRSSYPQPPFPQSTFPQQFYPPPSFPRNNFAYPNNMNPDYSYNPGPYLPLPPPASTTEVPNIPTVRATSALPPTSTSAHGVREPQ